MSINIYKGSIQSLLTLFTVLIENSLINFTRDMGN